MTNEITLDESKRLIALEHVITKGLSNFIEVGEALLEIRDSRLYRIEHGTFEEYCKGKWGITKQSAYQLISGAAVSKNIKSHNCDFQPTKQSQTRPLTKLPAAAVSKNIKSHNCDFQPTKQSQTRPLTKLPADKQSEAWAKSVESAGGQQPTAKQVEAVVVEMRPAPNVPHAGLVGDGAAEKRWAKRLETTPEPIPETGGIEEFESLCFQILTIAKRLNKIDVPQSEIHRSRDISDKVKIALNNVANAQVNWQ